MPVILHNRNDNIVYKKAHREHSTQNKKRRFCPPFHTPIGDVHPPKTRLYTHKQDQIHHTERPCNNNKKPLQNTAKNRHNRQPKLLNLVKNVALLKLSNGNIITPKTTGTVV